MLVTLMIVVETNNSTLLSARHWSFYLLVLVLRGEELVRRKFTLPVGLAFVGLDSPVMSFASPDPETVRIDQDR
jgi:hypothetical protein